MILKNIRLQNFRNYNSLDVELSNGVNIIYGNNAQGKTNLLESIYVLGLTKSHRSFVENNLITNNCEQSKIIGFVEKDNITSKYQVLLENKSLVKGHVVGKKLFIDYDEIKKVNEYISKVNVIIFYPEDLEMIKGSPNIRRQFLNSELSQLYSNYFKVLADYNILLKKRNEFLKNLNKNSIVNEIHFNVITDYLINKAIFLYRARHKFVEKLNLYCSKIYKKLSGVNGFRLEYKPNLVFDNYNQDYLYNFLKQEFEKVYEKEKKFGSTLIGPHRDELEFYIDDLDIKNYGSQGQQRMAVIAVKLSEIEIFKKNCKTTPILLLDDVFSELDEKKKNNLLFYIKDNIQTIITTTDLNNIDERILKQARIFKVNKGKIMMKRRGVNYGRK